MLVCEPCDRASGNLNKTSVREKSRSVYLPVGWVFFELFDDISLVLKVRRLCIVVDSRISAAKVCDCVISAWCLQVCGRWRCWAVVPTSFPGSSPTHPSERQRVGEDPGNEVAVAPKYSLWAITTFGRCFISLADCALKNQFSTQENWV